MSETTIQKTYDEWFSFVARAATWLNKSKGNEHTKLGYAISRMIPRVQKALEKAQRKHDGSVERLRIKCCLTDEKGKVLRPEGVPNGYEFAQSKLSELQDEIEKLTDALLSTEIAIKPYFATDIPAFLLHYDLAFKVGAEPLTGAEQEAFEGVVVREGDAEAALSAAFVVAERTEEEAVQ